MPRLTTICIVLFFLNSDTVAQQTVADSIGKLIQKMPADTAKVNRLNEMVSKFQYADPSISVMAVNEAIELAGRLNYTLGLATAYRLKGVLYVDRMVLDSGKMFYDKAYELCKDKKEKAFQKQIGLVTHNYGVIYHKKQEYDSATRLYLEAARIFSSSGQEEFAFFPYNNLSTMYSYLQNNVKSLEYAKATYASALKLNEGNKIVSAVNSVMSAHLQLENYDSVLLPLKKNLSATAELNNYFQHGITNNLLARYYSYGKQKHDTAVLYSRNALKDMQAVNNEYEGTNMLHNLGYFYQQAGNLDSAMKYFDKAIEKAKALGLDQVVQYSLENMVELEEKRGNMKKAYQILKELVVLKDSLQQKINREQVNELEARYQSEKKDSQIKLQQASIQRKNIYNYILIGSAVIILIISLLSFRNYKQKQKLQQQRIKELETEKKLTATEAVLKGEEQERTRLAKDLHDGLGGMLSGIKYSFNTMKGNLVMTPDNAQAFERSMDMLDSSIKEMRRVAHNMMPEALVKFGLDTALKDFCNDVNQSGALKVNYQSIGLNEVIIDQTTGITIYRIVQELLNNTMKHAAAKNAIVQVSKIDGVLSVTVEDDGKGFDTSILKQAKGIGWDNIKHRVEFLKGKLDVNSQPEKGTSVHIEFNT
ncbi:MAG: tetratricopeptide repeat protein [Bacteroidetes bacterium]|nr:MAG: tetratricopeptide repeat protein [Bacteroidota bacterium]